MYCCIVRPPSFSPTSAQTVLTELVSANVRSMSPKSSLPKLFNGAPEISLPLRPLTREPGSYLPESIAAEAVTVFMVEPGGNRPWVARLRLAPQSPELGSNDGLAASTLTAPVLSSIATTAPFCGRDANWSVATFWDLVESAVRRSSPTFDGPSRRDSASTASVARPVSGSL